MSKKEDQYVDSRDKLDKNARSNYGSEALELERVLSDLGCQEKIFDIPASKAPTIA